jgi:hypothetical protein
MPYQRSGQLLDAVYAADSLEAARAARDRLLPLANGVQLPELSRLARDQHGSGWLNCSPEGTAVFRSTSYRRNRRAGLVPGRQAATAAG